MSGFVRASKQMARAKIAMIGPSGSGKTFSSLRLARGLTKNGRVAVLDSENNSAALYSDKFEGWEYFTLPIAPPYTARKYLDAIDLATREKFDCLIIDSLTHVWAGEGGLLQQKEALDSRSGSNSYTNWQQITKVHEAIKSKILYSPINIITTMRSKQEYVMEANHNGKMAPKKVGLKPIQRDDLEYEFTVVFDIGMDHQYLVSKDRTDLFDGCVGKVTEETGKQIGDWLCGDIATPDMPDAAPPAPEPVKPAAAQPKPAPAPAQAPRQAPAPKPPVLAAAPPVADEMAGPEPVMPPVAARQIKNHAPGATQEPRFAPGADQDLPIDSAEYVIRCGQNWGVVGKKIIEINESTLTAALKQAEGMVTKGSRDPAVIEFAHHARKFLKEMGVAV